ncbi:MAG: bifunctional protein-serine/threonine kinase/phosphatase [Cellvibrionales bacterium]|nr:bifunctional protein-serine/threonine kinase/phosphatase [Cellvibrionales bacterium]
MPYSHSKLKVSCAQRSSTGIKPINEDSMGIRVPEGITLTHKGVVAVVADGVSTAEAGQEASQACVQNLLYDYYCTPDTWTVPQSVLAVVNALNRWLYSQGSHLPDNEKGFVTTLSLLIVKSSTAHLFHVGDSRIYRYRDGQLEQLTKDHAKQVGNTSYLARALGLDTKVQMDYRKETVEAGDQYLLTTDGIHDFLPDTEWAAIIDKEASLEGIANQLLDRAMVYGSNDNLTVQVLSVDQVDGNKLHETYDHLQKLPFPPLLESGQVVDGLTVIKPLYESMRSQLYLVEDKDANQKMVMKTPSTNFEDDPAYIERFISEAWIGKKVRHSKLVRIISPSKSPTFLYYLMQYVEGITLEKWIKQTTNPSIASVVRVARQIVSGLRSMHRHQVIHQDLKPSNIMLDEHGQVTIIDFGSCFMLSSKELSQTIDEGVALGTASYSAPECHLGLDFDMRCDQFSLAVILFEMLTGKLPFKGKLETIRKVSDLKKLNYQSATELNPYVPDWFDCALQKAMSFDPAARYPDIDSFLQDLEKPNDQYHKRATLTLVERYPLRTWQTIAVVEFIVILCLLAF